MIPTLIDKQDLVEVVRDEVAAILKLEQASQQALATTAGEDPRLWALRVFLERNNPWSEFKEVKLQLDATPIVNVWRARADYDPSKSTAVDKQWANATYYLDCYGYGVTQSIVSGHTPADYRAATEAQRCARLVRNIIGHGEYTFLGQRGLVRRRWIASDEALQPPLDDRLAGKVQAVRIVLQAHVQETTGQDTGQPLELLSATVRRSETNEFYLAAEYDFTT